jgi:uncharacterized protein YrrD
MESIRAELAKELNYDPQYITNMVIDEKDHYITFMCNSRGFFAKLHKSNKQIKKNSVRLSIA